MRRIGEGVLGAAVALAAAGVWAGSAAASPITPGDIVVYRIGDGTAAPTSKASAGLIDEYKPDGTFVQTLALPTSGATALTTSGTATTEAQLNVSEDGNYLLVSGYRRDAGSSSSGNGTDAGTINRVIGRIALDGTIDTSTTLTGAFSTSSVRGVASTDGTQFWAAGTSKAPATATGVVYVSPIDTTTSTGAAVLTGGNYRNAKLYDGELYISSSSVIAKFAGPAPTAAATPTTIVSGGSAYQGFALFDLDPGVAGVDTLYAVQSKGASGSLAAQIEKYSLVGGTWTAEGTLSVPDAPNDQNVLNMDGVKNADGSVTLYVAIPTNGTGGSGVPEIDEVTDASGAGAAFTGTVSTFATGPATAFFRGIAVVPAAVPEPATVGIAGVAAVGMLLKRRRRQA